MDVRADFEALSVATVRHHAEAEARGHMLIPDPPAVLTSLTRATCITCGDARITRPNGTTYGSATERDCPGAR